MKLKVTRRRARECAVQALYAWQISHYKMQDIETNFIIDNNMNGVNIDYFFQLCNGVSVYFNELDQLMMPYLFHQINYLGHVERAVLRIALFELSKCLDIPYKVVINEAIELAKIFGSERSHRFVNGILDKVAFQLRFSKIKKF